MFLLLEADYLLYCLCMLGGGFGWVHGKETGMERILAESLVLLDLDYPTICIKCS